MASSYSTNLALTLPVQGELSGTWGTTVNTGITNMVDEALGYQAYSATGGSDTLTIPDGATGVARSIYIQLNGTGGGTVNVPVTKTKMYFVFNNTASAITFKVTGATGVSIPAAAKMALVSNGTDIIVAQNHFAALTLGAALPVASGGTGLTAGTSGGIPAYTATGTLTSSGVLAQYGVVIGGGAGAVPTSTAVGTATHVLTSNGAGVAPTFQALPAGGVTTFTAGTTGFTPNTATSGAVTLAGTLATANGGTNLGGATPFTSGGVVYASSTSALATGSALYFSGANLGIGTTTPAKALEISTAAAAVTEVLRLTSTSGTGFLTAIGFQNPGLGNPVTKIYGGNTGNDGSGKFQVSLTNASGTEQTIMYAENTTASQFTSFSTAGSERARISSTGGFSVGTTANPGAGAIYATGNITAFYSSDIKFKENVRDIPDALATVNAIGGKLFDWKDDYIESKGGADGYFVQKADFGVVAQDVQKVFPIAVRTREDGSLAVDYEKLGALAFAAVGELTALVQTLATRVEALEAK